MKKEEIAKLLNCAIPDGVSVTETLLSAVLLLADILDQLKNDKTIIDASKGILRCEIKLYKKGNYNQLCIFNNNFETNSNENKLSREEITTVLINSIPNGVSKGDALNGILLFLAGIIYQFYSKSLDLILSKSLELLDIEIERFRRGYNKHLLKPIITGCKAKDITLSKPKNWPK